MGHVVTAFLELKTVHGSKAAHGFFLVNTVVVLHHSSDRLSSIWGPCEDRTAMKPGPHVVFSTIYASSRASVMTSPLFFKTNTIAVFVTAIKKA